MICFIWQLGLGCVLCTHREQYSCQFSLQEVNIWRFPSFGIHKSPKLLSTANRKWVKNFIIPNFAINPSIRRRCDNTIFEKKNNCIRYLVLNAWYWYFKLRCWTCKKMVLTCQPAYLDPFADSIFFFFFQWQTITFHEVSQPVMAKKSIFESFFLSLLLYLFHYHFMWNSKSFCSAIINPFQWILCPSWDDRLRAVSSSVIWNKKIWQCWLHSN